MHKGRKQAASTCEAGRRLREILLFKTLSSKTYNTCMAAAIEIRLVKKRERGRSPLSLLVKRLSALVILILVLWLILDPPFGLRFSIREFTFMVIVFTSIMSWVIGIEMRRKIRRDLGSKAAEVDLTSIDTWMKVDEVEQRNRPVKPD